MVKQIGWVLVGFMMALTATAANSQEAAKTLPFTEGTQYVQVKTPSANQPHVLEFFSFYCPHCYQFESVYHVNKTIEKNLPEGVKFTRYHADFLGPLGKELSRSWAVAVALGVETKVTPLIFEAIHKTQTLKSVNDIRALFIQAGVKGEDYDSAMNSFMVNAFVAKQKKAAEDLQLRGVPAVFVNGKYMVKNDGLSTDSVEDYAKEFSQVVNYLLSLK